MLSPNSAPLQPSRPAPASPTHAPFSLKRKTMSVTQTYYLAHKARAKLAREASRSDHDLRLLVGHANLLDCLMLELADAEREQESWFNQSVRGATKHDSEELHSHHNHLHSQQQQHIEYEDTIIEVPDEDEDWDSDSSSDDDEFDSQPDEEDVEMADAVSLRRVPTPATATAHASTEDDYAIMDSDEDDEDDEYAELGLVRTASHSPPPELDDDSDTSEEETMPPSPPTAVLTFSDKEAQKDNIPEEEETFYTTGFYIPSRNPARVISAL